MREPTLFRTIRNHRCTNSAFLKYVWRRVVAEFKLYSFGLVIVMYVPVVLCLRVRQRSRLVAAPAPPDHAVAAEADSAVNAAHYARAVQTLGGTHHWSCRQRDSIVDIDVV